MPLIKYINLLPLNAGFVKHPNQFKWSSCKNLYVNKNNPDFMDLRWFEDEYSSESVNYDSYLLDGSDENVLDNIKKQIYLGDNDFILLMQGMMDKSKQSREIPRDQLSEPISKIISGLKSKGDSENVSIAKAYLTGNYTLKQIGDFMGLHYSSVSRIVKEYESLL